jgi:hypothetical protein
MASVDPGGIEGEITRLRALLSGAAGQLRPVLAPPSHVRRF